MDADFRGNMQETKKKWFAVRTKSRQEETATMHYMRQGFTVYSPRVQSIRRHARKTEKVMRPLFPGYIFLHLGVEEQDWTAIGSTIGAIGPVRFNDYCPPVPDWVIAGIQSRENDSGYIPLRSLGDTMMKPGAKVTVDLGDKEIDGIFLNFRDEDRVVVLLDILQRQLPVVTSLAKLKAA
jgi:transcriptional antiterminator RfaH